MIPDHIPGLVSQGPAVVGHSHTVQHGRQHLPGVGGEGRDRIEGIQALPTVVGEVVDLVWKLLEEAEKKMQYCSRSEFL